MKLFIALLLFTSTIPVAFANAADSQSQIVRRITIFPFKAPGNLSKLAEDAWWKVRSELTKDRRFLVASRHFMNVKEVLQARNQLDPADVLVLSKLLEAHALITCSITRERIHMSVYEGQSGWLLWEQSALFDQDIPVNRQIIELSSRLVQSFIASIPFQGFLVKDQFTGKLINGEGDVETLSVDIGVNSHIQEGDVFQVIGYNRSHQSALYDQELQVDVLASGRVLKLENQRATVEIVKKEKGVVLSEFTPVRFPKEAQRLAKNAEFATDPALLLLKEINKQDQPEKKSEKSALMTALTYIGNALLVLVLAF